MGLHEIETRPSFYTGTQANNLMLKIKNKTYYTCVYQSTRTIIKKLSRANYTLFIT